MPVAALAVESRSHPTRYGDVNPARLPTELKDFLSAFIRLEIDRTQSRQYNQRHSRLPLKTGENV